MKSLVLFVATGGLFLYSVYGTKEPPKSHKKKACSEVTVTVGHDCHKEIG